jgi:sec-independent protein translocase protein TatA
MGAQVQVFDCPAGHSSSCPLHLLVRAAEGKDGAVVVRVAVKVQGDVAGDGAQVLKRLLVPSFAHVDHAFEHEAALRTRARAGFFFGNGVAALWRAAGGRYDEERRAKKGHGRKGLVVLANIIGPDLIWVGIIALVVLFGGSQLPKLARNIGEAGKEFRRAHNEAEKPGGAAELSPTPSVDDKVTLSKGELDALLAEREQRARREAAGPTL